MSDKTYTYRDRVIDSYLNTENLRPGPPARLVNRIFEGKNDIEPEIQHKINYISFTIPISRNIPWNDLTAVKLADYGGETSFFLEFLNSKLLILKVSNDLPLYFFGSLMLSAFSVATPKSRFIEYSDPEFQEMILNLERASQIDPSINNKIRFEVKTSPFVLLYEYIPFLSLFDLGQTRANILLNENHFYSRELMIDLGRMIALDIYLNNSKRLPFAWLNNGNPNNILFKVNLDLLPPNAQFKNQNLIDIYLEGVYGIDTLPEIYDPEEKVMLHNLENYLKQLNETFKLLCYEFKSIIKKGKALSSFQFNSFDKISSMIKNSTGYQLTPTNQFHIAMGIIIMINQILDTKIKPIKDFIPFVQKEIINKDWGESYLKSIITLKIDHFKYIYKFFENIKEDNDEIFKWIEETTCNIYQQKTKEGIDKVIKDQMELKYKIAEQPNPPQSDEQPQEQKKKKKEDEQLEYEEVKDFFNYNKNDKRQFENDVHNGIFDFVNIENDMIYGTEIRKYKQDESKPPEPEPNPEEEKSNVVLPPTEKKEPPNDIDNEPYEKLTLSELENKIKGKEFVETTNMKLEHNPEEGEKIKKEMDKIEGNFYKEKNEEIMKEEKEKKEREERVKKEQENFQREQLMQIENSQEQMNFEDNERKENISNLNESKKSINISKSKNLVNENSSFVSATSSKKKKSQKSGSKSGSKK